MIELCCNKTILRIQNRIFKAYEVEKKGKLWEQTRKKLKIIIIFCFNL